MRLQLKRPTEVSYDGPELRTSVDTAKVGLCHIWARVLPTFGLLIPVFGRPMCHSSVKETVVR
jgi:hypothetical protein